MKAIVFIVITIFYITNRIVNTKIATFNTRDQMEVKNKLIIKVGDEAFETILFVNDATAALLSLLPIRINMTDLNSNEKYYQLATDLPTSAEKVGTIHVGDLMLWQSNTLVLFYKNFNSGYSYTKLGRIENPQGLESALGTGNVTISFEIKRI